jgi:hypothetical protein
MLGFADRVSKAVGSNFGAAKAKVEVIGLKRDLDKVPRYSRQIPTSIARSK